MGNVATSDEQERQNSTDGSKVPTFTFSGGSSNPASGTDAFSGAHNSSSQQLITPPGTLRYFFVSSLAPLLSSPPCEKKERKKRFLCCYNYFEKNSCILH